MSQTNLVRILLSLLFLSLVPTLWADAKVNPMFSDMMTLSDAKSARASSFNPTGGNEDFHPLPVGETLNLLDLDGTGIIRHVYFSIWGGQHYLRDMVLRAYFDGSDTPCIEVPFGDFFGLGHERTRFFTSLMVTVNPGDLGIYGTYGFNSYFPMPFSDGARMTLTNEGDEPVVAVWYQIEYDTMDELPPNAGRFHASWNRENLTEAVGEQTNITLHDGINNTGDENYVVLDAEGHGNLAGIFLNIDNTMGNWYGEGDDMIFIDGEGWPASYNGTGSEEIFGGGAVPTDEYDGPYTGYHLIGNLDFTGKVSMYRFYVNDPVRFSKSIRMTIEHGHANNISNDYSSTAFWYQTEPHKPFRALPPAAQRRPRAGDDPHDTAFLRLIELRQKVFGLLIRAIRQGVEIPQDLSEDIKWNISQTYFKRDYDQVMIDADDLERRLDEVLATEMASSPGAD